MTVKPILQSKLVTGLLIGAGLTLAALLVFQAGMVVGERRATFSYRLGERYYRGAFGGHPRMMGLGRDGFLEAHGAAGKIISVQLPTFVIEGPDQVEKVVLINDGTSIRRFRDTVPPSALRVDDFAVVIGAPNDQAQVVAKLIRLMPEPPTGTPFMQPMPR